jgi:chromosome segregation ATPase
LDAEIENLMSKASSGADPSEKKGVFSSDDLHQFQTQLKFSKVQMDQIQLVPEHLQNSMAELQSCNSHQAEKIKADEKEIAMLRHQVEQLQAQVTKGTQLAVTERNTTGQESAAFHDGRAQASSQPTGASDQAPKHVQENARMLEEEAHRAEYQAEIDSLRHELELTKRALKSAEDGRADALEQIQELQQKLASIHQEHRVESQAHLVKLLAQSRDEFNADRSELMIKLKASNQEIEKLRVELDRRSSPDPCKACESKEIQTTAVQAERNNLQKKLDTCRAHSADKEGNPFIFSHSLPN